MSAATGASEWTGRGMHPITDSLEGARVGVVGAGRLGTALSAALREAGLDVEGPLGRGEVPRGCDAIVLCVPDAEIAAAAAVVAGAAPLIGHTSGATGLDALARSGGAAGSGAAGSGAAAFGLHPLQTFAARGEAQPSPGEADASLGQADPSPGGAEPSPALAAFFGAGCAVAGDTEAARDFAAGLARTLGMTPFEIDDAGRAAYHAAASVASNFLVTLQAAAERIAAGAGLEPGEARALLAPLLRRTLDNVAALGPARALTGPVARGDEATVEAHREAVQDTAPELLGLFDELVRHTRALAGHEVAA